MSCPSKQVQYIQMYIGKKTGSTVQTLIDRTKGTALYHSSTPTSCAVYGPCKARRVRRVWGCNLRIPSRTIHTVHWLETAAGCTQSHHLRERAGFEFASSRYESARPVYTWISRLFPRCVYEKCTKICIEA